MRDLRVPLRLRARGRSVLRAALTAVLSMLLAVVGLTLVSAPASASVPSYACTGTTIYALKGTSPHTVSKVDAATGVATANGEMTSGSSSSVNALALPSGGGRYIYAFDRTANAVLRFDATNHGRTSWTAPANSSASSVVAGAVNPQNGIYYYASSGTSWKLFAFNTTTNTAIGQVGTISGSGLSNNGDLAFDAQGNLYIVSNADESAAGALVRVNGTVPTTAGSTALTVSLLSSTPGGVGQYNSMAFDPSGALAIGVGSGKVVRVNPANGQVLTTATLGIPFVDFASCSVPSTAQAQVSFPNGRYDGNDQVVVSITGGGITTGNTGTTTGTDSGLQNAPGEVAGPVVVMPGSTYTVSQTAAANTNLADYTSTWKCVTAADGATIASGSGSTGTFTAPNAAGSSIICTFTNLPLVPAIELDKTGSTVNDLDANGHDVGDTITYGFKVVNTGATSLNPVTVSDPRLGTVTCPTGALAAGQSRTCTSRTYVLTQADVDAGKVDNTASASGTSPTGALVSDPDSVTTTVAAAAALVLDKTASSLTDVDTNGPDAGDTVTYGFKVTNTGAVTLSGITVTDGKVGPVTCPSGSLAPGASVTCSPRSYPLTQADVNAGKVDNTATATGTKPGGGTVSGADTVSTTVPTLPALELDKTASAVSDLDGNGVDAGDTITYGFKVANTGNVPLSPVTVADPKLGSVTCPSGSLAPGASVTCTQKTYVLTQADVNAGKVDNTATASGTSPNGTVVTDTDSTTTVLNGAPSIELDKTAGAVEDLDGNGADAGDTITYGFKVTNTGAVTLTGIAVTDTKVGAVTCPAGSLAPGASLTCSPKTYTVTQAEVNDGKVDNTATVTGTAPSGAQVTAQDATSTTVPARPALELDKTAGSLTDVDANGADAGDTITYGFKVTNTGNVPLSAVTVSDPKVGPVTCPTGSLAPGDSATCTPRTYTLTQSDVDAGTVDNTATATGTSPAGTKVTATDTVRSAVPTAPGIALDKTAGSLTDVDGNGPDAGDTITYGFKVTNTGNVALQPVTVSDAKVGPVTCPTGSLAPGASVTCTPRTYTLTQADVTRGSVDNTATASGTTPGGAIVQGSDSTTTVVPSRPALSLDKTAGQLQDVNGNGADAGDTITYRFTVTNTGNVPLTSVSVTDPKVGPVTCPSVTLAPGASVECDQRTWTVTSSEVEAGLVVNTASAAGTAPDSTVVRDEDSTSTPVERTTANLVVTKTIDNPAPRVGDIVTYTLTAKNSGTGDAQSVVLRDTLPTGVTFVSAQAPCTQASGTVTCELGTLAGGATRSVTIRVTVDPLPSGPAHQHLLDVQKAEVHMDLEPGQTRSAEVSCAPGYVLTDGSGRIDHVDQGTGTPASVRVTESRATGLRTWQATMVNEATGRAQAKVFAVCVAEQTETVEDHRHALVVSDPVTTTQAISGATDVRLTCAAGQTPVQPGFRLDGTATVRTSHPAGDNGWTWTVDPGDGTATTGDFSMRCLDRSVSSVAGHRHELELRQVFETATVPAGGRLERTLTCADDAKGIVAGYSAEAGLVNLGNDPRPIVRVFKLLNPTAKQLDVELHLLCLSVRNKSGAGTSGSVTNTATGTTSSTESTTADNSGSAKFIVNTSAAPAAAAVVLTANAVKAQVECTTDETCVGTARLVAARTTRVEGRTLRAGTVLARTTYQVSGGEGTTLRLVQTRAGKRVLDSLRSARLDLGATSKVVRVRG